MLLRPGEKGILLHSDILYHVQFQDWNKSFDLQIEIRVWLVDLINLTLECNSLSDNWIYFDFMTRNVIVMF